MPREVFVAGQVLTAAELNVVSDQSVMVFAGTAARGSAIPSPTEGMVTYRSDDDTVEVFDGSVFKPVGAGQILQVVSTTKTDTFSTASSTFADITNLNVSITPSSASNKVLILASLFGDGPGQFAMVNLLRDSTIISIGDAGTGQIRATTALGILEANRATSGTVNFLDSPNTTSAVTYKLQMRTESGTVFLNRTQVDTANGSYIRAVSTITAMEVAG